MVYEFKAVRRVEFSETDMAGIMHFSNYFKYMETAEHEFLRSVGFSVYMRHADPPWSWPRVHAACDYFQPVRFENRVQIHMIVREIRSKTLRLQFRFYNLDRDPSVEIARGELVVVAVAHLPDGSMKTIGIPPEFLKVVGVAPKELWVPFPRAPRPGASQ